MKTAGYLKILAFSQCSGAVMPLRGRNEQARSLRKNCPLNNNLSCCWAKPISTLYYFGWSNPPFSFSFWYAILTENPPQEWDCMEENESWGLTEEEIKQRLPQWVCGIVQTKIDFWTSFRPHAFLRNVRAGMRSDSLKGKRKTLESTKPSRVWWRRRDSISRWSSRRQDRRLAAVHRAAAFILILF